MIEGHHESNDAAYMRQAVANAGEHLRVAIDRIDARFGEGFMDDTVTLSPATRRRLQQRRRAETFDLSFRNQLITITTGFYADGTLGEVFIDAGKSGQDVQSIARDAGVMLSIALQHGVPVADLRHAVTRDSSGAAASILGAIVDCISTKTFSGDVR